MYRIIPLLFILLSMNPLFGQDEDDGRDPMGSAALAMRENRFYDAEQIYRMEVDKHPQDYSVKHLLCHSLINQKKFREADSILRRMEEDDTARAGTYWYMGLSAERQLKDSIAAQCFKKYISKTAMNDSRHVKSWLHVGSAWRRKMHGEGIGLTEYTEMVYHYQKYLELNPMDPYAGELRIFLEEVATRKPAEGAILVWVE